MHDTRIFSLFLTGNLDFQEAKLGLCHWCWC